MDPVIATLSYIPFASAAFLSDQAWPNPQAVIKGSSLVTSDYSATALEKDFASHLAKLKQIESDPSLWPEGAERPSGRSISWAQLALQRLEIDALVPTRVVASAEGGIAICFVNGDKYADIECLNTGAILGVISNRRDRPVAWEIEQDPSGITRACARIREFIDTSSTLKNDPKR